MPDYVFNRFEAARLRCMQAVTKYDFYVAQIALRDMMELRGYCKNQLDADYNQCFNEIGNLRNRIMERGQCPDCEV